MLKRCILVIYFFILLSIFSVGVIYALQQKTIWTNRKFIHVYVLVDTAGSPVVMNGNYQVITPEKRDTLLQRPAFGDTTQWIDATLYMEWIR